MFYYSADSDNNNFVKRWQKINQNILNLQIIFLCLKDLQGVTNRQQNLKILFFRN